MKKRITLIIFSCILLISSFIFVASCNKNKQKNELDCSKINATYSADIKPFVTANCNATACHNAGSLNGDFTGYTGLKTKADNGSLKSRVCDQKNMPPTGPCSTDQINKFTCWIQSGSPNN